jgi:hypothetical protein
MNTTKNSSFVVNCTVARLEAVGNQIFQVTGDADTLILYQYIDRPVTKVANDTDVLVLLLYHFHSTMADIILISNTENESTSVVSIRSIHQAIGAVAAKQMLVIHAIAGCDIKPAVYGRTKVKMGRLLSKFKPAESLIAVLNCDDANHESFKKAGLELMSVIFGEKYRQSLNHMNV